jgi:hypothetical protein
VGYEKSPTELRMRIGGITISFISDSSDLKTRVNDTFKHFVVKSRPEVIIHVHYGYIPPYSLQKKVFDSDSTWSLYYSNKKCIFRFCSPPLNPLPNKIAILDSNFKSGDIYYSNNSVQNHNSANPLEYPFGELLMINLLSQGKGVLAHSCGIDNNGKGMLFAGESGAGKSTLSNLWKGKKDVTILSDDRTIVRKIDGQFWIYGTPWHGDAKVSSPGRAPLEKIFFLKHAEKSEIKKMSLIDATSRIVVCSFPTFWDKKGMEFTLGFIDELVTEVPCYELGFVPDKTAIDFVRNI